MLLFRKQYVKKAGTTYPMPLLCCGCIQILLSSITDFLAYGLPYINNSKNADREYTEQFFTILQNSDPDVKKLLQQVVLAVKNRFVLKKLS